jgi:uncharacterized protein (UPF0335 family)
MDAQPSTSAGDNTGTKYAGDQLKSIVERIERLEEEKKSLADDIRDVYAEAKGNGFEVKALRRIVRIRRMDASQRSANDQVESILEVYMSTLGML